MRWNCPHCLTLVSVADDKLGAGWLFSKCYKCSGFSLVRRAEVEVVKVDGSPFDGKVNVSSNSSGVQAKLSEVMGQKKGPESTVAIPAEKAKVEARPNIPLPRIQANKLFEELKELDTKSQNKRSPLKAILGVIAVSALGSATYLYLESQSELQKKYRARSHSQVVDQLKSEAMAPARNSANSGKDR